MRTERRAGAERRRILVVHRLPGRTRLSVDGLFLDGAGAARLARHLSGQSGVQRARASHRSGRLLLYHDRSLPMTRLLDLVREGLELVGDLKGGPAENPAGSVPEPEDRPLSSHLSRVGSVGGMLLYLLVRRKVKGPSHLAASPLVFNLTAATALVAGYPNIRSGLRYFAGRRTAAHDLLLSLTTLTVLFLGEGFLGLTVIWLTGITDLVQAFLGQKARQVFPLPEGGPREQKPDPFTQAARDYAERAAALALGAGAAAGLVARDFRRTLAVLLAANPSAAGHAAPAALTAGAARAQSRGIIFANRRAVAALAGVDALIIPWPAGIPKDTGDGLQVIQDRSPTGRVEKFRTKGIRFAVLGREPGDLEAMRAADLAAALAGSPPEVLAEASLLLPDADSFPVARRLAREACQRARRALTFVRVANLTGLVLAGAGWLPAARGTLAANLTSLATLLISLHPGCRRPLPGIFFRPVRQDMDDS